MSNVSIEQVWNDYSAGLRAFLRSRVSNEADAEDLLQDVLIKVHGRLGDLRDTSSLKSWLYQITANTITDFYRSRAKGQGVRAEDLWYDHEDPDLQAELEGCVAPFIDALPVAQAELLRAVELGGQSQKDYAAENGVSYSTLKSRVQSARQDLRREFEKCCQFTLGPDGSVLDAERRGNGCDGC